MATPILGGLLAKGKGATLFARAGAPWRRPVIPAAILIADDDPNILRALSFLMQKQGHSVRTVGNGVEALAEVEAMAPDLLLLDVMMPRLSGSEVCRTLRASPAQDALRIVMLTARGQEADQRMALALGADAYIIKPFAVAEVVDCVERLLAAPRRLSAAG